MVNAGSMLLFGRAGLLAGGALALGMMVAGCSSGRATFDTPDAAADALVGAISTGDDARLEEMFGPEVDELMHSGDDVADDTRRAAFLQKCAEGTSFVERDDGMLTLVVGDDDWPFAVPLARSGSGWRFDTEAGREEVLNRRIGSNELHAIESCLACVDAQLDYAVRDPDGDGVRSFAPKFFSAPGARDGLYWPTEEGEGPSPLGALVAEATAAGYEAAEAGEAPRPYHGYVFRMLLEQGPEADGGERAYVLDGQMIGGFAMIARPADYGNSGVMTFMTSHSGIVYEKDLGSDTERIADAMSVFNPDESWHAANAAPFESVLVPETP